MPYERRNREGVLFPLLSTAREREQPEVLGVAGPLGDRLGPEHTLRGREVHGSGWVSTQAPCALESQHVRGVRHDLGHAQAREHPILVGERHGRAASERGDRGQLDGFKLLGRLEQLPIDGGARPEIDGGRGAEHVPLVVGERLFRSPPERPALHDGKEHRVELGTGQLFCEHLERRPEAADSPALLIHEAWDSPAGAPAQFAVCGRLADSPRAEPPAPALGLPSSRVGTNERPSMRGSFTTRRPRPLEPISAIQLGSRWALGAS